MKLQCVVTSYKRPLYLRMCLASMRQDDIELYVVDGGSDEETKKYIREVADGCHFMEGNPGADVLKNEGIKRFVTQPHFVMTSDDFEYQQGWTDLLYEQWAKLNEAGPNYAMLASPSRDIVKWYHDEIPPGRQNEYREEFGVTVMPRKTCMVAGTIMDTGATHRVGLFPVYGKTGEGDIAISLRFARIGLKVGYLLNPVVDHIGRGKYDDYPAYSADYDAEASIHRKRAREDNWRPDKRIRIFSEIIETLPRLPMADLGAGHCKFGQVAHDFGFPVTAIDARCERIPTWIKWPFIQQDVREADLSPYGIVSILGLLYHLTLPDQIDLLKRCAGKIVIVDTHTARPGQATKPVDGYEGADWTEEPGPLSSVGNDVSFWHTEASLRKLFADCGFNATRINQEHAVNRYFWKLAPQ